MKGTFLKIFLFVVVIDLFYGYIGQTVTQSEQHPPEKLEITPETETDELIAMGFALAQNKGGCLICHKVGETGNERGPDLRGIGARAASRQSGIGAEEYLTRALEAPEEFLVEGYSNIMPRADMPPADLTATEMKAVIAYLQSLGGEISVEVTSDDVLAAAAKAASGIGRSPQVAYLGDKGCVACHDVIGEERRVGPPLTTVAQRLTKEEIRQSIVDPDAVITAGYPPGLMPKTYRRDIPPVQLEQLVTYISELGDQPLDMSWSGITGRLIVHPLIQLAMMIFLVNTSAWVAIEWLERW